MKRDLPLLVSLVTGLSIVVAVYFTGIPMLVAWKGMLDSWHQIVSAMAVALGVVNLWQIHRKTVSERKSGWNYSLALLASMIGMMVFGIFFAKSPSNEAWKWIYAQAISPMNATVYGSFILYTASAAYRAFVARSREAAVMLIAAVTVMLGRVPLGSLLAACVNK